MQRKQARQQNVKCLRVHLFFFFFCFFFLELARLARRRNAFFNVHTSESTKLRNHTKKEAVDSAAEAFFAPPFPFQVGVGLFFAAVQKCYITPPHPHPIPLLKPPSLSRPRGITRVNCLVKAKSSGDDTTQDARGPNLQLNSPFGRCAKNQKK